MKKSDFIEKERVVPNKSMASLLKSMEEHEGDGYYRDSTKYTETVWNGTSHKAYKKPMSIDDAVFQRGFFLFNMVKLNAVKYLEDNKGKIPEVEEYPTNFSNEVDFFIKDGKLVKDRPIIGVDITAAYWYIAFNYGIITEKTFKRGLEHMKVEFNGEEKEGDLLKRARLQALSVLGKPKVWFQIKNGKKTRDAVTIGGDEKLNQLYRVIRHTCYWHMRKVMELLGSHEFLCWKTDAIYFHDTPENRKKVMAYFDSVNLEYKTLEKEEEAEEPVKIKRKKKTV